MLDGGLGSSALLRATIVAILASGSVVATSTSLAQTQAQQETKVRFEIPAGPLAAALQLYAESAAVQLVYDSELVAGLTTAGFTETLTPREGLLRLLEGSKLVAKYSGRTITLAREKDADSRRVLGPVRVEGATAEDIRPVRGEGISTLIGERGGQDKETRGLRPVIVTVGAGVPTPIDDVPRSVSVITQEQMDLQNIDDIGEALRRTPGITLVETPATTTANSAFEVYSRGQRVELYQVDGGAPRSMYSANSTVPEELIGATGSLDLTAYDRIEVVHGPAGAQVGSGGTAGGSAGGVLNLVRKRPLAHAFDSVTLSLGSFDQRKVTYDVSRPDLFGTPIATRTAVSWSDTQFSYNGVRSEGRSFYTILDVPMSEQSRIEFSLKHDRNHQDGSYQGVSRYLDGPLYPWGSDYNPVADWAYSDSKSTELGSRLSVDLPRNWSFQVQGSYVSSDSEVLSYIISPSFLSTTDVPPAGAFSAVSVAQTGAMSRSFLVDAKLAGTVEFFGLRHALSFSGDYSQRATFSNPIRTLMGRYATTPSDLFTAPDTRPYAPPLTDNYPSGQGSMRRGVGLMMSDMISWRDLIELTATMRRSFYSATSSTVIRSQTPFFQNSNSISNTESSPSWAPSYWLTVKPFKPLSVGMSYSEGTRDQSSFFSVAGSSLQPAVYENLETVISYATPDWRAQVSYYQLDLTNSAQVFSPPVYRCLPTGTSQCYEEGGASQRSRGVDVQLTGRIFSGVDITASYNRNENETVATQKRLQTQTPDSMAKLFATWRPAHWPRFQMYGGATYRDSVYYSGVRKFYEAAPPYRLLSTVPYDFTSGSYVSIDVGASYRLNDALELSLFVENVTDEVYLSTVSIDNSFYGKPRSFTLEVKANNLASRWWPSSPPEDTTYLGNGWYSTLEFGMTNPSDIRARSSGPASTGERTEWRWGLEGEHAMFGRLGRNLDMHWQAEVEAGSRSLNFTSIGEPSGALGLCAPGTRNAPYPACDDPGGTLSIASILANAIYRFGDSDWRVRPYVGVGLGGARVAAGIAGRAREDSSTVASLVDKLGGVDEDYVFAGQLLAGVSASFTPRFSADLTYRHFETGKAEWVIIGGASAQYSGTPQISTLGSFSGRVETGALTLGLRYAFAN
ncbi:TonB-dependent receptor plug domain-containing protein [Steroidobacter flavus]|uniref:TonB-dependent receptor plug domain-containing protein n=1 Tax=Steroidobacter flavus TaxID=1842136 RepID=A0ABV8STU9_9GAMM